MKSALLLEYDAAAHGQTARLLKSLGYLVASAATPQSARQTLQAVRFDAVLTRTDLNADDRRSFTRELAWMAADGERRGPPQRRVRAHRAT
jgi:CheY-like chemotaxis protein